MRLRYNRAVEKRLPGFFIQSTACLLLFIGAATGVVMHRRADEGRRYRDANGEKGIEFARRALAVAGNDPRVRADAAHALPVSVRTSMR